ncbi:hypothetical protein HDU80_009942 [Chytriomyces hyalinus]|nr:hypothetical protein HDU80_009942 [Chytriomyces hyalinus]
MNDDMDVPDQDEDQVPLFPYSDDMVLSDKELTAASKESVSAVPPPILCFGPAPAGHICSRCTSTNSHAQSRRNDMQSAMFTALRESINTCNPSPQRHPHSTQSTCLVATVPTVSAPQAPPTRAHSPNRSGFRVLVSRLFPRALGVLFHDCVPLPLSIGTKSESPLSKMQNVIVPRTDPGQDVETLSRVNVNVSKLARRVSARAMHLLYAELKNAARCFVVVPIARDR